MRKILSKLNVRSQFNNWLESMNPEDQKHAINKAINIFIAIAIISLIMYLKLTRQ